MGWVDSFTIKSETSPRLYTISRDEYTDLWGCSCPGWRSTRNCKHLRTMGLPTQDPIKRGTTTRTRSAKPSGSGNDFAEAGSPGHYDTKNGTQYGNSMDWRKQAERVAAGKGPRKIPAASPAISPVTAPAGVTVAGSMADDMALVGITRLPDTADELLAAMQARARVLNDPVTGNPAKFWRMFSAYERLMEEHY